MAIAPFGVCFRDVAAALDGREVCSTLPSNKLIEVCEDCGDSMRRSSGITSDERLSTEEDTLRLAFNFVASPDGDFATADFADV